MTPATRSNKDAGRQAAALVGVRQCFVLCGQRCRR
jgi:hypothetical protein